MCVCVCVYVVYEDTHLYNDMGMTGITRRMWFMRTFSVSRLFKTLINQTE